MMQNNGPPSETFCDRWLKKASGYDDTTLAGVFDSFFTLYVIYDHLCTIAADRWRPSGNRKQKEHNEAKTKLVVEYVGAEKLSNRLRTGDSLQHVKTISMLNERGFYAHYNRKSCEADFKKDEECIQDIKRVIDNSAQTQFSNEDITKYCQAILKLIYATRNNMFHGRKGYEDSQMYVLPSMSFILKSVVEELRQKLEN